MGKGLGGEVSRGQVSGGYMSGGGVSVRGIHVQGDYVLEPNIMQLLTGDSPGITLPLVGCWVVHHSTKPAPKLEADPELCFQKKILCCYSLP